MNLRSKLILVFLLLAVLPLAGLTFYSYWSSLKAFRQVVEAESATLANDMGGRMELVTRDIDQRVERLGDLPFFNLLTSEQQDASPEVRELYANMMKEMGEAAVFVDALEYWPSDASESGGKGIGKPVPEAPPPPPALAHAEVVAPSSVVIYMREGTEEEGESSEEPSVVLDADEFRVSRAENNRMVVRRHPRARAAAKRGPEAEEKAHEILHAREELAKLENVAKKIQVQTAAVAEAAAKGDEAATERLEKLVDKAGEIAARQKKVSFYLKEKFERPVWASGKVMGTVKAQINAPQVLHTVLERTRHAQGEIPFAVDSEGSIYTPDSQRVGDLEQLELRSAGLFGPEEKAMFTPDWVVVTRHDPRSDLTFGIARPVGDAVQGIQRTAARNLGYGLAMISLAILGIIPLSNRMTKNLSALTEGAERLAGGDLDTQVPVRSQDEIGQLGETFNRMALQLKVHQENVVEQERLQKELEIGRHIQEVLLPRTPLRLPFAEVRGISLPARQVGGDFFDYFSLPDKNVAILIGDVSGKGVPAALLMANLQATLRARLPLGSELADLATQLDDEIYQQTPAETYLTLFMAILDPRTLTLDWVNAGHNTQFAIRGGVLVDRMPSTGRPLGLLPGAGYETGSVVLQPGDDLFLYTDGLLDMVNREGEVFGSDRLEKILSEGGDFEMDELLARVEMAVGLHRGSTEAADDATMMVLRVGSQQS
jgi:serine phosphatase RsbU (regulator of sigma subunit)